MRAAIVPDNTRWDASQLEHTRGPKSPYRHTRTVGTGVDIAIAIILRRGKA